MVVFRGAVLVTFFFELEAFFLDTALAAGFLAVPALRAGAFFFPAFFVAALGVFFTVTPFQADGAGPSYQIRWSRRDE